MRLGVLNLLLRPTAWVTFERAFGELFFLILFAIQAPILGPSAFGLMAAVMVFILVWESVPAHAITEALISIRKIDHLHYSTVTTTCVLFCIAFGATAAALAQPIATMFGDAELAPVMRVMAISPVIQALSISPFAAAQRELQFQSTALRTVISVVAGGVVGLVLALTGGGVWALVWQALIQRVVAAIVLWLAVPISLGFAVSRNHFREIADFALPVMVSRAMAWASGQLPRFVLGIYLGPNELGLFTLASRLNSIVNLVAISPKATVARVELRRFANDHRGLGEAVRRLLLQMSVVSFPICAGGAAIVPTLFHVWLDPRWYGAIIPSQLMLLASAPYVTFYVASALLLAVNLQRWEAGFSAALNVGTLIAVIIASRFGLIATTSTIAVLSLAALPLPIVIIRRKCGLSLRDMLLPQAPAFVAACSMGFAVSLLRMTLGSSHYGISTLCLLIGVGVAVYVVLLLPLLPKTAVEGRGILTWLRSIHVS
jgi:O-antigen/teichoic acid export membrane protein